jgi:hypothetical protein
LAVELCDLRRRFNIAAKGDERARFVFGQNVFRLLSELGSGEGPDHDLPDFVLDRHFFQARSQSLGVGRKTEGQAENARDEGGELKTPLNRSEQLL